MRREHHMTKHYWYPERVDGSALYDLSLDRCKLALSFCLRCRASIELQQWADLAVPEQVEFNFQRARSNGVEMGAYVSGSPQNHRFGYGGAFRIEEGQFGPTFALTIPPLSRKAGVCPNCNGTGKDKKPWNGECFLCLNGTKLEANWKEVFEASASMSGIARILRGVAYDASPDRIARPLQLMFLTMYFQTGGFSVTFTPALVNWLKTSPDITAATIVMKAVEDHLWPQMAGDKYSGTGVGVAYPEYGAISMRCHGNCACLGPENGGNSGTPGYEASSHNVDTAAQQLVMVSGLAMLHRLAREAGVGL